MWYRLLAYENRLYRLFMLLGLTGVNYNYNLIKNYQILDILKPYILDRFDINQINDLKKDFDRGLNSFLIGLAR